MDTLEHADAEISRASQREGPRLLRLTMAIVYLWFGAMKLRRGRSDAEDLAGTTINRLTRDRISVTQGAFALGVLECAIGLGLLNSRLTRPTLALIPLHLVGAASPFVVLPRRCFHSPGVLTMEGQFIVKNGVLAAAAFELLSRSRGSS
jgi:uncharacterized membrane protein YkgB